MRVGEAARLDRLLGREVLVGDERRVVGRCARRRRVEHVLHAGRLGGLDGRDLLRDARPDGVGRDQQQPVDAGQRGLDAGGVGEVGRTDDGALRSKVGELLGRPGEEHDVARLGALEGEFSSEAAEVAGGSGDGDGGHDDVPLFVIITITDNRSRNDCECR